ncbi:DNA-processing protein DprA [Candidatus Poriferisodalis sp.]|uniref:DNA-processing protein DprA n=1 Tax=Candidatus Poriferisodalis sp. TaxID=3101277 RepID=UPI003AF90344
MRRGDDALATISLVSRLCADRVRPLKASEFWKLSARLGTGPSCLLGMKADDLAAAHDFIGDFAHRIGALMGRATALAFELERLEQSGIRTLTPFDEHYPTRWPERLGPKAPPLLYAAGATELLGIAGLGVVGSRDVSPLGAEVAVEAAKCAVVRGIPLVSGGARGVDQLAMNAALDWGGAVVGVLADSLSRKLRNADVRAAIHDGRAVMCAPYSPDASFSAGNAMGRNKLIYAQAAVTLVVASDQGSGGTWTGATEALDRQFGRVAVWRGPGEGPGNEDLERHGAVPISEIEQLDTLLDGDDADANIDAPPLAARPAQGTLFDGARPASI